MAGIFRNIWRSFLDCNCSFVSTRKIYVHLGFLLVWVDCYLVWFWKLFLVFAFGLFFFRKTIPTSSCPPPKAAVSLTSLHLSNACRQRPHWQGRVFLPRRLGGRGARLLVLLLQPAGGGRLPAPAPLCFWWPGRQQHPPGIWNMVRSGGSDGCLEIFLFPCCAATVAEEGVWGLIIQEYNPMNSKASWTPCPLPGDLQRNFQVHLSGPDATAKWRYGSWRSRLPPDFIAEFKSCFT